MAASRKANYLINEKSPYLLQHAYNPVNWYPWGKEAFEKAKKEDKPIFLSIGYSTCHWCHVMERESFENAEVAKILNLNFISIKVDREERPDIDAVYMNACQSMTGTGGWPLTILMAADQKPFYAATYLPRNSRGNMIGILDLLPQIVALWNNNRKKLDSIRDKIYTFLRQQSASPLNPTYPDKNLINRAIEEYKNSFDTVYGGFGTTPKFPAPHNLIFLLSYSVLEKEDFSKQMAEKTLIQMYKGGIFDHIGGGFSRYSTDRKWLIPHFEKMLYDNALLSLAYLQAYHITHKPLWERIASRTLDYVLHEMTDPNGGFYCAQDADSDGVEGKYYTFTPNELEHILDKNEADLFCSWFGITKYGNFEGRSIPNLIDNPNWETESPHIDDACLKLYAYRFQRASLYKDDKILTAWNALMISAFAKAGSLLHKTKYLLAAEKAYSFLSQNLMHDNYLLVRWREEAAHDGHLDDYAFLAYALLALYEATYDPTYLQKCTQIAMRMLNLFFDPENGGFYFYSSDSEILIDRPKEFYDGAIPSGNSVAAIVLIRLAHLTGEVKWQDASDKHLQFLTGEIRKYPIGHSFSLLAMLQVLYPSKELLCVTSENKVPPALSEFLSLHYLPNLTVLVKTPKNARILEDTAPFTKRYPIPTTGSAYYLCQKGICAKPVYDMESLYNLFFTP